MIDATDWVTESDETDNIFVDTFTWVNPPQLPNLTYVTPPGWDGPIVPSGEPGTCETDLLYSNQPTYIDWAIQNSGSASAGFFRARLLVDGIAVQSVNVNGLAAGATTGWEDVTCTVPEGTHMLKVEIDYAGEVAEINESDNTISQSFVWDPATITATGEVWYQQLDGRPGAMWHAGMFFRVELWDADAGGTGQLLDTSHTDGLAQFSLGPVPNVEEDGSRQDIYVRVYSECDAAVAGDELRLYYPYSVVPFSFSTGTIDNVLSGTYDWGFPYTVDADTVASRFFYAANAVRESRNVWMGLTGGRDPGRSKVFVHTGNGTFYEDSTNVIFVEPESNPSYEASPDIFDQDIILEEYGHSLADRFTFMDSTRGLPHYWNATFPPEDAAYEGFGAFWSCLSRNDPYQRNSFNSFADTQWVNLESGQKLLKKGQNRDLSTANAMGKNCEGAVAATLWDICDTAPDDTSSQANWGDTVITHHHSDGIGDTLSDGINHILSALLDRNVSGHHPDNLDEFWAAWFQSPSFGHAQAMRDIWYEHGEVKSCCVGMRGNVDGSVSDAPNVADLNFLVAAEFQGGPPPPCFEEADVDASGGLNVSDITRLAAYLFAGGPALSSCP